MSRPQTLGLTQTTAPTIEPVTTAELKSWLGYGGTDQDSVFDSLIVAAREWVETFLRRQLITATWTLNIDRFPLGDIDLPRLPVQSVSSISYVDTEGSTQTLSTSKYDVSTDSGRVAPAYNESWPSTRNELEPITITYVAGYGDDGHDVPESIRQSIMMIAVGWWHAMQCGGSSMDVVNPAARAMLSPYRVLST